MKYFYENDNNEQVGPIDIDKLKSINIKSSTLIWKEGTENWSEAKNFEELKELFIKPPPLPLKNKEPKIPENAFVKNASEIKTKKHSLWSYKGRMRRSEYFGYAFLLGLLTRGITYLWEGSYEDEPIKFLALLFIPMLYLYIIIAIKRLHDMSFYGWFFFISFIPLINLILVFWDGIEGPNKYGPDPKGRQPRNK
jgi:uncharacterized membrane protein YhaH (DUF805 family)